MSKLFCVLSLFLCILSPSLSSNPITIENAKTGTTSWKLSNPFSYASHIIEGYASKTSINAGETISFFINTLTPTFNISIYRMGYYAGLGGRLVYAGQGTGIQQSACLVNTTLNMLYCQWNSSYSLTTDLNWCTGVYLAKLTSGLYGGSHYDSYAIFTARNDSSTSPTVFQSSVTTWQAYNYWKDSAHDSDPSIFFLYDEDPDHHSYGVSFDRPYALGYGTGHFMSWELPMLRWLESMNYDVTYITNIDTHTTLNSLVNRKVFLSVGHDEYWTSKIRDNIEYIVAKGVSVGFFGANVGYWQIRLEPSASQVANRVVVCYKVSQWGVADPIVDPSLITTLFKGAPIYRPEQSLVGQMYREWLYPENAYPLQVKNRNLWPFNGAPVPIDNLIHGVIGVEFDVIWGGYPVPPGLLVLTDSTVFRPPNLLFPSYSTLYTARSGARVFSAGSITWSRALYSSDWPCETQSSFNSALQAYTANILNNFLQTPVPGSSLYVKEGSLNAGYTQYDGVSSFSLTPGRIAVVSDNRLYLKNTGQPLDLSYSSTTARVGYLLKNGTLFACEGALSNNMNCVSQIPNSDTSLHITDFAMAGTRIAVLVWTRVKDWTPFTFGNGGYELWIKDGSISSTTWTKVTLPGSIIDLKAIAVSSQRIAVVSWNNGGAADVYANEGPVSSGFTWMSAGAHFATTDTQFGVLRENVATQASNFTSWTPLMAGVKDYIITGQRIVVLVAESGTVYAKDNLESGWTWVSEFAISIGAAGQRLGVLRQNGELYIKEGSLNAAWYLVNTNTQKFVVTAGY